MDAYNSWQSRRSKPSSVTSLNDRPRITQADVLREHTLSQARSFGTYSSGVSPEAAPMGMYQEEPTVSVGHLQDPNEPNGSTYLPRAPGSGRLQESPHTPRRLSERQSNGTSEGLYGPNAVRSHTALPQRYEPSPSPQSARSPAPQHQRYDSASPSPQSARSPVPQHQRYDSASPSTQSARSPVPQPQRYEYPVSPLPAGQALQGQRSGSYPQQPQPQSLRTSRSREYSLKQEGIIDASYLRTPSRNGESHQDPAYVRTPSRSGEPRQELASPRPSSRNGEFRQNHPLSSSSIGSRDLENERLDAELAAVARSRAEAQRELDQHNAKQYHTEADVQQTRSRQLRLERLQLSLNQLMEKKQAKQAEAAALATRASQAEAAVQATRVSQEQAGALSRRVEELETQLAHQMAEGSRSAGQESALIAEVQQLRTENGELGRKLVVQQQAAHGAAQKEEETRQELEVTNQELLRCIEGLEGVNEEVEGLRAKAHAADSRARETVAGAEADRRKLQELVASNQQMMQGLKSLEEERNAAATQNQELLERAANLERDRDAAVSQHQELIEKAAASERELISQKDALQLDYVALQRNNQALQEEHLKVAETLNDLSAKHESVFRAHREATQELAQLQPRSAEVNAMLEETVAKLESLDAEHSRLKEENAALGEQSRGLNQQNKGLQLSVSDLTRQVEALRDATATAERERTEKEALAGQLKQTEQQKAVAEAALAAKVAEHEAVVKDAKEVEVKAAALKQQAEEATARQRGTYREYVVLQETCNKMRQELEQAQTDARQLHIAAIAFEEDNVRLAADSKLLERQNARLEEQAKGHRSMVEQLKKENSDHQRQLGDHEKLRGSNAALLQDLVALQAVEAALRHSHSSTQQEVADLRAQNQRLADNLAGLQDEIKQAAVRVQGLEAEKAQLEGSRADSLHELSELEVKVGLAESSQKAAEAELQELRAKHEHVQGLHAQTSEQVRGLTLEQQQLQREVEHLRSQHGDLQASHGAMQEARSRKEAEFAELSGIVVELQRLHTTATAHIEQLAGERDSLVRERDSQQGATAQQLSELQTRYDELHASHTQAVARADALQEQLADAQGSLKESQERVAAMESSQEAWELQVREAEGANRAACSRLEEVSGLHAALRSDHLALTERMAALQSRHDDLEGAHTEKEAQLTGLRDELAALRARNSEIEAMHGDKEGLLADKEAELAGLRAEHSDLRARHVEVEGLYGDKQGLLATLEANLAALRGEHSALQARHAEVEDSHRSKEELLVKAEAERFELQAKHEELTRSLAEKEGLLAGATADQSKLQDRISELQGAHGETARELEQFKEQHAMLTAAHDARAEDLQSLTEEFTVLLESCESLEKQLQTEQELREEMQGPLDSEKANAAAAALEVKELKAELEDVYARMSEKNKELGELQNQLEAARLSVDEEQAVTRGVLQESQRRGNLVDELKRELDAAIAEGEVHQHEHDQAAEDWEKLEVALRNELEAACQQAQEAEAEVGHLKALLETAEKQIAEQEGALEEASQRVDGANSEALTARQAAASLEMDLATALDAQQAREDLAASNLELALQRQRDLEDQLEDLKASHARKIAAMETQHQVRMRDLDDDSGSEGPDFMSLRRNSGGASSTASADSLSVASKQANEQSKLEAARAALSKARQRVQLLEKQVKQTITGRLESDMELKAALILLDDSWSASSGTPRMAAGSREPGSSYVMAFQKKSSELRGQFSAALARVEDNLESQEIHRAVVEKLKEYATLKAQNSSRLIGAESPRGILQQPAGESLALDSRSLSSKMGAAAQEAATAKAEAANAKAEAAALRAERNAAMDEKARERAEADRIRAEADSIRAEADSIRAESDRMRASLEAANSTVAQLEAQLKAIRDNADPRQAAMAFELWRLLEDNEMLRARTKQQELDIQRHMESTDGSLSPLNKNKIQYHVRNKQELEELRNETTVLLRERYQLEQCVRYLAVRCGLSKAEQRAAMEVKEVRTPLGTLQTASQVPRYKFRPTPSVPQSQAGEAGAPVGGEGIGEKPDEAVEQQILTCVGVICEPPANRAPHDPLRPSLTPGALLTPAPPTFRKEKQWMDEWLPSDRQSFLTGVPARSLQTAPVGQSLDKERKLHSMETPPVTAPFFIQPIATPIRTPISHSKSHASMTKGLWRSKESRESPKGPSPVPKSPKSETPKMDALGKKISRVFHGRSKKHLEEGKE